MSKFGGSITYAFMKRIYLSLIVLVCANMVTAQQDFYIFIQEPSHQPFYVRMGEESHSSSAEGHIILSKLKDSVYNLYIGFPRSRDEVVFTIEMKKKDHGYELRNVDGRRKLFDLQLLQIVEPVTSTQVNDQTIRKTDDYSELMAGVVDDSAVLYTSPADTLTSDTALAKVQKDSSAVAVVDSSKMKKEAAVVVAVDSTKVKKAKPETPAADSTGVENESVTTNTALSKKDTANVDTTTVVRAESSVRDKRDIIRLSTENIVEGKLMIYVDRTGPVNDTIRIIIPRKL
jgi:hypothetical protein